NIRFHVNEVAGTLADCAPTILVCAADYLEQIRSALPGISSMRAVFVVGEPVKGFRSYDEEIRGQPLADCGNYRSNDPLLIRYTGGTTGRAKGIVHTADSLLHVALDVVREFSFQ